MNRSPDLLLLDEPTGDLDTLNTIRIMNLLVELNIRKQRNVFISTLYMCEQYSSE